MAPEGSEGAHAPDAVAPPPGNPRFPMLDAVRAVAALSVLTTHVTLLSGFNFKTGGQYTARLDSGVALFFVLSGFLLYRPWVAARLDGRPRPRVASYAWRRALRIVPAYWLALTLLAIWPGLAGVWDEPWRYYLFLQWTSPGTITLGLNVAWSLCVEVCFYIALPFFALAMDRALRGRERSLQVRAELIVIALLAALSVGSRQLVLAADSGTVYQSTLPAFLFWFGLGMTMAVLSASWAHRAPSEQPAVVRLLARAPWVSWALAAVAMWVVATRCGLPHGIATHFTQMQWLSEHLLYGVMAALFTLPAVFGTEGRGWVRAVLSNRLLGWLGLISYGIFLWHIRVAGELSSGGATTWLLPFPGTIALWLMTFGIAATMAALSYYLVERPILSLKERPPWLRFSGRGSATGSAAPAARRAS